MMTKQEVLDEIYALNGEEQILWMRDLGYQLTVAARSSYPFQDAPGSLTGLMSFNEVQHRIYGRIRDLENGLEWTTESFVDLLFDRATSSGVLMDMDWALRTSLKNLRQSL